MLTIKRLHALLSYDPETGVFRWKQANNQVKVGAVAGWDDEYIRIMIDGQTYRAHRLAWFYVHGWWPTRIDHADGNRFNNAIANLRPCNQSQNAANAKRYGNNNSGFKGVQRRTDGNASGSRWRARIRINGKLINLGHYASPEAAHAAYKAKAKELFGEFARAS